MIKNKYDFDNIMILDLKTFECKYINKSQIVKYLEKYGLVDNILVDKKNKNKILKLLKEDDIIDYQMNNMIE